MLAEGDGAPEVGAALADAERSPLKVPAPDALPAPAVGDAAAAAVPERLTDAHPDADADAAEDADAENAALATGEVDAAGEAVVDANAEGEPPAREEDSAALTERDTVAAALGEAVPAALVVGEVAAVATAAAGALTVSKLDADFGALLTGVGVGASETRALLAALAVEERPAAPVAVTDADVLAVSAPERDCVAPGVPVGTTLELVDADKISDRVSKVESEPLAVGENEATGLHEFGDDKPCVRQPGKGHGVGDPEPAGQ